MTFASVADKFLSGGYPVPMMVLIVVIGGIAMLFFSKRMLNKLNIATKSDIAWLETATKSDIARLETATKSDITQLKNDISQLKSEITQLREDFSRGLLQLKENDLFHTNKAILIMARALITDESVYGRIKDAILENATDRLRGDLRGI
ncbi:MAG: hypothetical protein LBD07_06205 [Spirochaetaceae bacterium]|jgi:hypothetical protein|nr:hypothetical protein [Spirochaetaceae bacterium]